MNAKVFVGYKKGEDYNPKTVRAGKLGSPNPEFKCFNCGTWVDNMKYILNRRWYPRAGLKYNMNFLCGPECSVKIIPKYNKYFEYTLPDEA